MFQNLSKSTIIIGIIALVILVFGLFAMGTYNSLNSESKEVDNAWSNVESDYQRRFDLVPNLVASVEGELKQEQTIFKEIADARSNYSGAKTVDEKAQAAESYDSAISRLLVITENYPVLQSSNLIQSLMVQLEGTENRIKVSRDRYNDSVKTYNTNVSSFPNLIYAKLFGYSERYFFKSTSGADTAPSVKF